MYCTDVPAHTESPGGSNNSVVDGVVTGFTVIATILLIAVVGVAHAALLVSCTLTISAFNDVSVYELLVAPGTDTPFTNQTYPGVRPVLAAVVVNVVCVPAHTNSLQELM